MRLLTRQRKAFSLAGTVGLPAPFPAVGLVFLVPDGEGWEWRTDPDLLESDGAASRLADELLVKVVHEISPKVTILRYVRLSDVSALFLPDDPWSVNYRRGTWFLERNLRALALSRLSAAVPVNGQGPPEEIHLIPRPGIIFVPEAARVLMQVELGMTAAESAEYHPPARGQRYVPRVAVAACDGLSPEPEYPLVEPFCDGFAPGPADDPDLTACDGDRPRPWTAGDQDL